MGQGEGVVPEFTVLKCNRKSYNQLKIGEVGEANRGRGRAGMCGAWQQWLLSPWPELVRKQLCCVMYKYECWGITQHLCCKACAGSVKGVPGRLLVLAYGR